MERLKFLERVETFLRDTGMSASAFGMQSKAEPNFVFTLREGRECKEAIQQKVIDFMDGFQKENNSSS